MGEKWIVFLFPVILLAAIFTIKSYARRLAYGPHRKKQKRE